MTRPVILIADDEPNVRRTLSSTLKMEGYDAVPAANGAEALQIARGGRPLDAVILDLQMPEMDGMSALKELRRDRPELPVLILTAHGSVQGAVEAVRAGAYDFLEKPTSTERLLVALANALKLRDLETENEALREEASVGKTLLGDSRAMRTLREQIRRVAGTDSRVLLLGENGTGKELVAQELHRASSRSDGPMIRVNCAAVPEGLFESELFGHEKGAFTGATRSRAGKFERADGGTLFLDEVGEIPLDLQPKLLRALESGEVERVGGEGARQVDARVIAATNRDLAAMVKEKTFREDLYYRLNVVPISVPSLRERASDVKILAEHFLESAAEDLHLPPRGLAPSAVQRLEAYSWPGNVRELRNLMERCLILAGGLEITEEDLLILAPNLEERPTAGPGAALADRLQEAEGRWILEACRAHRWNLTRTAEALGLERSHLYKKMKSHDIHRPEEG